MRDTNEATALAVVEPMAPLALFGTTDPVQVIAQAARVATALAQVVNERKLYAVVNGKKFPTVEAWTLLGSMLGVFPIPEWVHELHDSEGNVRGFEARVRAQTLGGRIVGAGEARCVRGESKTWHANAQEFAMESMAQTRATSKALRGPLDFIFKLAGFQPTLAEEMDGKDATGEIPADQASPETVSALREAQTVAAPVASGSPSAQVNSQTQDGVTPASGPSTTVAASGPRAKRSQNVVAAPQAAPKIPENSQTPPDGQAQVVQPAPSSPPAPSQPLDPGKVAFLDSLRDQAREAAAILRQQSVLHRNRKSAEKGEATVPVPSNKPNSESDEALRLLVSQAPKDLKKLNAKKLEELDEISLGHVLEWLEDKTEKLKAAK